MKTEIEQHTEKVLWVINAMVNINNNRTNLNEPPYRGHLSVEEIVVGLKQMRPIVDISIKDIEDVMEQASSMGLFSKSINTITLEKRYRLRN